VKAAALKHKVRKLALHVRASARQATFDAEDDRLSSTKTNGGVPSWVKT